MRMLASFFIDELEGRCPRLMKLAETRRPGEPTFFCGSTPNRTTNKFRTLLERIMPKPKSDPVNHPSHYTQGEIECIDAIREALGPAGFVAYCRGCQIKYNWRTGLKDAPQQEQAKAEWYAKKAQETIQKHPGLFAEPTPGLECEIVLLEQKLDAKEKELSKASERCLKLAADKDGAAEEILRLRGLNDELVRGIRARDDMRVEDQATIRDLRRRLETQVTIQGEPVATPDLVDLIRRGVSPLSHFSAYLGRIRERDEALEKLKSLGEQHTKLYDDKVKLERERNSLRQEVDVLRQVNVAQRTELQRGNERYRQVCSLLH